MNTSCAQREFYWPLDGRHGFVKKCMAAKRSFLEDAWLASSEQDKFWQETSIFSGVTILDFCLRIVFNKLTTDVLFFLV